MKAKKTKLEEKSSELSLKVEKVEFASEVYGMILFFYLCATLTITLVITQFFANAEGQLSDELQMFLFGLFIAFGILLLPGVVLIIWRKNLKDTLNWLRQGAEEAEDGESQTKHQPESQPQRFQETNE